MGSTSYPLSGKFKWDEFLAALKEIDYKDTFSLETYISLSMPEPVRENIRVDLALLAKTMATKLG